MGNVKALQRLLQESGDQGLELEDDPLDWSIQNYEAQMKRLAQAQESEKYQNHSDASEVSDELLKQTNRTRRSSSVSWVELKCRDTQSEYSYESLEEVIFEHAPESVEPLKRVKRKLTYTPESCDEPIKHNKRRKRRGSSESWDEVDHQVTTDSYSSDDVPIQKKPKHKGRSRFSSKSAKRLKKKQRKKRKVSKKAQKYKRRRLTFAASSSSDETQKPKYSDTIIEISSSSDESNKSKHRNTVFDTKSPPSKLNKPKQRNTTYIPTKSEHPDNVVGTSSTSGKSQKPKYQDTDYDTKSASSQLNKPKFRNTFVQVPSPQNWEYSDSLVGTLSSSIYRGTKSPSEEQLKPKQQHTIVKAPSISSEAHEQNDRKNIVDIPPSVPSALPKLKYRAELLEAPSTSSGLYEVKYRYTIVEESSPSGVSSVPGALPGMKHWDEILNAPSTSSGRYELKYRNTIVEESSPSGVSHNLKDRNNIVDIPSIPGALPKQEHCDELLNAPSTSSGRYELKYRNSFVKESSPSGVSSVPGALPGMKQWDELLNAPSTSSGRYELKYLNTIVEESSPSGVSHNLKDRNNFVDIPSVPGALPKQEHWDELLNAPSTSSGRYELKYLNTIVEESSPSGVSHNLKDQNNFVDIPSVPGALPKQEHWDELLNAPSTSSGRYELKYLNTIVEESSPSGVSHNLKDRNNFVDIPSVPGALPKQEHWDELLNAPSTSSGRYELKYRNSFVEESSPSGVSLNLKDRNNIVNIPSVPDALPEHWDELFNAPSTSSGRYELKYRNIIFEESSNSGESHRHKDQNTIVDTESCPNESPTPERRDTNVEGASSSNKPPILLDTVIEISSSSEELTEEKPLELLVSSDDSQLYDIKILPNNSFILDSKSSKKIVVILTFSLYSIFCASKTRTADSVYFNILPHQIRDSRNVYNYEPEDIEVANNDTVLFDTFVSVLLEVSTEQLKNVKFNIMNNYDLYQADIIDIKKAFNHIEEKYTEIVNTKLRAMLEGKRINITDHFMIDFMDVSNYILEKVLRFVEIDITTVII
ncbi:hypothetical protein PYW08_000642 [Mythimna loreyi]|uniref:Uncharacterized protein n=1 Tax=Mythimna loreyi TaxID=667449 RepID=A0ACC2RD00_9NEOP|nr:hypothetical protein PYW08_000642 [Mythimna loreyi]